jgi:hypothetical protein
VNEDSKINDATKQLNTTTRMNENNYETVMTKLMSITSNIHRVLGGLSYIATNSVKECPTFVRLVPAEHTAGNTANDWCTRGKTFTLFVNIHSP